jgi:excisionase family DNA binding protein
VVQEARAPQNGAASSRTSVPAVTALSPRLLTVEQAAEYLAIGPDTVYALVAQGVLKRVRIPTDHGGELRKILLDRVDLDRAIDAWRERP